MSSDSADRVAWDGDGSRRNDEQPSREHQTDGVGTHASGCECRSSVEHEGGSISGLDAGCCGGTGAGHCGCESSTEHGVESCSEGGFESIEDSREQSAGMPDLGHGWTIDDVDDEWERRAVEELSTVEFDTELGVELSRDALRVAQGEMTKAQFHEKHAEAVLGEFGIDERPTRAAFENSQESGDGTELPETSATSGEPLPGVPGADGGRTRRGVLKAAGATLAAGMATGVAGCLDGATESMTTAAADGEETGDVQMGMVIDTDRCIACLLCVEACKRENDTDRGTHWMHVFRYEDDEFGSTRTGQMPRPCQHCSEPSCTYVCPTQARYKRDGDGIVLTNYDTCIGCRYCEVACPYGVNFLGSGEPVSNSTDENVRDLSPGFFGDQEDAEGVTVGGPPPEGVMGKCTFCVHRQDDSARRGTTACEDACPVDAIHFGDMNDPDSAPRAHLRRNRGESRFNLLEQTGNEPNIVYIGEEPSKDAEPIDGPYTYGDLGMMTHADGHEEPTGSSPGEAAEVPDDWVNDHQEETDQ